MYEKNAVILTMEKNAVILTMEKTAATVIAVTLPVAARMLSCISS